MPRLFRKPALRSAPSAPQHPSFEPPNGKPSWQPNVPAARPGVVVAPDASSLLGRHLARTLRSLLHSWGQAANRVSKVTNMGTMLLHGCYTKDLTAIQVALR